MKRFLVIPIMLFYFLAVSGVNIHVHYCGKMMASWSLLANNKGCKDDGCKHDSKKSDGCCKDKVITAKTIQDQQIVAPNQLKLFNDLFVLPAINYNLFAENNWKNIHVNIGSNQSNAPPGLWQNIPLYKLQSRIVYYG